MKIDFELMAAVFIIGLIVSFACSMLLGDIVFTGVAIIYLSAVIAGLNSKKKE